MKVRDVLKVIYEEKSNFGYENYFPLNYVKLFLIHPEITTLVITSWNDVHCQILYERNVTNNIYFQDYLFRLWPNIKTGKAAIFKHSNSMRKTMRKKVILCMKIISDTRAHLGEGSRGSGPLPFFQRNNVCPLYSQVKVSRI